MPDPRDEPKTPPATPEVPADQPGSLISRPFAALVLVIVLAASALSAWLLVTADFESAQRRPPAAGAP
jgi:hypothetical protein